MGTTLRLRPSPQHRSQQENDHALVNTPSSQLSELLDQFYVPVMGVTYQVLGDIGLANRAVETIFAQLSGRTRLSAVDVWRCVVRVLRANLARGFAVTLLRPQIQALQATLLNSLAQLDPEERMLMLLYHHEGLSAAQLADIFEVDRRDVQRTVVRARERMLEDLRREDALF